MSKTFTTMHHRVLMDIAYYFVRRCRNAAPGSAEQKQFSTYVLAITNADRMLKGQEPRVLTREELKQFEGSPCWFESSGTYKDKNGFWIIPVMFRTFSAGIIMSYTSALDGLADYGELGLSEYNKAWHCWSAKPTKEQREVIPWNT